MVTRKPVASQSDASAPPYPTTPTSGDAPQLPPSRPAPVLPPSGAPHSKSAVHGLEEEEEEEEDDEWDKSDSESWEMEGDDKHAPEQVPAPLRVSRPVSQQSNHDVGIPASLRIGPPGGVPQKSKESLVAPETEDPWRGTKTTPPVQLQSHNPFLRPQNTGQAIFGGENGSSSNAWGEARSLSAQRTGDSLPVAELPADHSPSNPFSKMSISELPAVSSPMDSHVPLLPVESYSEKEAVNPFVRQDSIASTAYDPQTDLSSFDAFSSRGHGLPESVITGTQRSWQEQQAWEQSERERKQAEAAAALVRAERAERERLAEEEWHTGEADFASHDDAPHLPSRMATEDQEQGPPKPPRPQVDTSQSTSGAERSALETPTTAMKKQRNQTYQIKKVRWFDSSSQQTRVSPILIQNANGPCPLLALVNALTLSTSLNVDTALVETLRTREQVSLGLLVDAVFEELMSGRRGDAAQDLPDVTDLYSFLIKLHTGMNVNPRFVFVPDRSSLDMHPALRPQTQPGGFEETREMKLYSTFDVPLMHGWLPQRDSSAYAAFERSAKTYEDAQNIQFYEEELEAKINSTGLNPEEQILFEDLHTIKQFLATWPTQLTEYGLNVLLNHVRPGEFAILFRNDHFSTIYKEPRSQQILTLVTDEGYSSHDEIVWESLVDLNGQGTEHFSGDFRPVSHNDTPEAGPAGPRGSSLSQRPVQSLLDVDQGWTSVQGKNKKRGKSNSNNSFSGGQDTGVVGSSSAAAAEEPLSAATDRSRAEQEDHDLALAMQLQEEEEVRHRREQDARRREQELSQQVLTPAPAPVPASQPIMQRNRPLVPPRQATNRPTQAGEEPPPPTYEQAHKDRRFVPPRDHPASPHAPVNQNTGRRHSAYMENANSTGTRPPANSRNSRPGHLVDQIPSGSGMGRGGRPVNAPHGPGIVRDPNEKCTIM
jgi:hypothetical protein